MGTFDDDAEANAAIKALIEMFSQHHQPGRSSFSGIRYVPEIQDGKIVFVPDPDDVAFNKAFNEVLDKLFGATEPPTIKSR